MTRFDDDPNLPHEEEDTLLDSPEVVEGTPPVDDSPEPVVEEPTPPTPPAWLSNLETLTNTMAATAEQQRQEQERRQAEEQQRQWQASQPVPLLQQEKWREEFMDLQSRVSYEPQAATRMLEMQQQLADERAQQIVQQQLAPLRMEMQAGAYLQQAAQQAAQRHPGMVQADDFQRAAEEIFGGNRAQIAQALNPQNPNAAQLQQQITAYAIGNALMNGRIVAPTPTPAPPNPRSAARPTPGTNAKPVNEITDPQAVLDALYYGGN